MGVSREETRGIRAEGLPKRGWGRGWGGPRFGCFEALPGRRPPGAARSRGEGASPVPGAPQGHRHVLGRQLWAVPPLLFQSVRLPGWRGRPGQRGRLG